LESKTLNTRFHLKIKARKNFLYTTLFMQAMELYILILNLCFSRLWVDIMMTPKSLKRSLVVDELLLNYWWILLLMNYC